MQDLNHYNLSIIRDTLLKMYSCKPISDNKLHLKCKEKANLERAIENKYKERVQYLINVVEGAMETREDLESDELSVFNNSLDLLNKKLETIFKANRVPDNTKSVA